jgi:hypothetical protein
MGTDPLRIEVELGAHLLEGDLTGAPQGQISGSLDDRTTCLADSPHIGI